MESIISDDTAVIEENTAETTASNQEEGPPASSPDRNTRPMILRLIQGSLLGGDGTYQDIYPSHSDDACEDTSSAEAKEEEQGPTLRGVARQVLKEENKRLAAELLREREVSDALRVLLKQYLNGEIG